VASRVREAGRPGHLGETSISECGPRAFLAGRSGRRSAPVSRLPTEASGAHAAKAVVRRRPGLDIARHEHRRPTDLRLSRPRTCSVTTTSPWPLASATRQSAISTATRLIIACTPRAAERRRFASSRLALTGYPARDRSEAGSNARRRSWPSSPRQGLRPSGHPPGCPWRGQEAPVHAPSSWREGGSPAGAPSTSCQNYGVRQNEFFEAGPSPPDAPRPRGAAPCGSAHGLRGHVDSDVAEGLEESGAEILVVITARPFEADKQVVRLQHAVRVVTETGLPLVYPTRGARRAGLRRGLLRLDSTTGGWSSRLPGSSPPPSHALAQ
jgi:hypothetical protein